MLFLITLDGYKVWLVAKLVELTAMFHIVLTLPLKTGLSTADNWVSSELSQAALLASMSWLLGRLSFEF